MTEKSGLVARVEKLRSLMAQRGVDGILLRKRRSFAWLTGGKVNHIVNTSDLGVADLLIFADTVYCITTKMDAARIEQEELLDLGFEFELVSPEWYEGNDKAVLALCQGKLIGADVPPSTVGLTAGVDLSTELAELTYVMSGEEMERYRWLSQVTAKALEATCREITPGMTEREIQAVLAAKVIPLGINPQVILVAADERIYNFRHPLPTAKKLRSYAMVVICGERWGLVTNVTRFVHFGSLPPNLRENRLKLAEIDLTMNLSTRLGALIRDVFRAGIAAYEEQGHPDDWRYLHQGGPTGYASREFLASLETKGVVQLHQAFAWNPSLPGVKSEDTILVRESGNEFLTHTDEWEYVILKRNGQAFKRPDILIR